MQNELEGMTFQDNQLNENDSQQPKPLHRRVIKNTNNRNMKNKKGDNVKVMFLGGVGEIGKNMMVIEYQNDIIVIDSGLSFPTEEMPGIDLVVPDITYLIENKNKIRGIFLTHGHEDHIGGLPYVLNDIHATLYGSRLTLGLVESKLREFKNIKAKAVSVTAGMTVKAGCFKVEFINVTHSIAGSFALAITTPVGVIFHTGDFKIDLTPINGEAIDLRRIAEYGRKGVLLLTCESTNVERKGYSMSERTVGKTLDELFASVGDDRILVATFASNIHRMQQVMDLAVKYGRKIAFSGRSMINVSETALKLGELHYDRNNIIDIDKIDKFADKEIVILTTGSQGEPMSALTRMATDDFGKVRLGENDTVILSASPIPGNEKAINNVINNLCKKGVNVIYHELADVHVSGHAYQEEIKIIHSLIKPKYFMPVHGEYKHLMCHQRLALEMGMEERNIIMPDIGMVVEVNENMFARTGSVPAGQRLVDGTGVGDMSSVVLRDRALLSEEGLCVAVLGLSSLSGELVTGPEIISRGFIYQEEAGELITEAREVVQQTLRHIDLKDMDITNIKQVVRKTLANYFFKKTKRKPMILPIIYTV